LVLNLKKRGHWEEIGVDGRIILKWILKKQNGRMWIGFFWLRMGTSGGQL
jgi:hypothetical protein